jgi:hypothetical protein
MKSQEEIIEILRESLPVHSVNEILELQHFESYEIIKEKHRNREIVFGFQLQENVVDNFGSTGEVVMDKILISSPIVMILLSIILAIVQTHYYLFLGIPLSILGLILTTPRIMKQGYSLLGIIMINMLIAGIYFCFKDFVIGFLLLSYSVPNFLLTVSRQLNMQVFERAVLESEMVFIYYFLRGECYIKSNKDKNIFYKK